MNDRVIRHQVKFFESPEESIHFWRGLFFILNCQDFALIDLFVSPESKEDPVVNFKITKLCEGFFNLISLDGERNYLWVGQLPLGSVKDLQVFIEQLADGLDPPDSNRLVELESFLRFNFNRRSTNAMLNGMLAFFLRFKEDIIQIAAKNPTVEKIKITDQIILDNYTALLNFLQSHVLPMMLPEDVLETMAESDGKKFPYSYTSSVNVISCKSDFDLDLPEAVSVCSYVPLPDNIVYMALHRELAHIVYDYFGRSDHELVIEVCNSDHTHFECRTIFGDVLLAAEIKLDLDRQIPFTPCCLEFRSVYHRCFLFDGLDVLKSIYIKISSNANVFNGLDVELRLFTTHALPSFGGINAYISGHADNGEFIVDDFRVNEPEHEWITYSGEIECLIAVYITELTAHEGCDIQNRYDTIYINEANVIQSFAEILNIDGS